MKTKASGVDFQEVLALDETAKTIILFRLIGWLREVEENGRKLWQYDDGFSTVKHRLYSRSATWLYGLNIYESQSYNDVKRAWLLLNWAVKLPNSARISHRYVVSTDLETARKVWLDAILTWHFMNRRSVLAEIATDFFNDRKGES